MNEMSVPTSMIVSEPAAVAGRAIIAWDWYYYFTEARLATGEVVHH
jgi:hypothetical protein